MPDIELWKLVFNGGAFGLLVVITIWTLFLGAPMIRDTIRFQANKFEASVGKLIEAFERAAIRAADDNRSDREACRNSRHAYTNYVTRLTGELVESAKKARDEDKVKKKPPETSE